jgi:hypothetical protein
MNNSKSRRKFHSRDNKGGTYTRMANNAGSNRLTLELSKLQIEARANPRPRVESENVGSNHFLDASLDGRRRRCRHFLTDGGEFLCLPGERFELLAQMIVG